MFLFSFGAREALSAEPAPADIATAPSASPSIVSPANADGRFDTTLLQAHFSLKPTGGVQLPPPAKAPPQAASYKLRVRFEVMDASGVVVRAILETVVVPSLPAGSPAGARVELDVAVPFDGRSTAGTLLADGPYAVAITSDFHRVTAQNANLLGSSVPLSTSFQIDNTPPGLSDFAPPDGALVRDPRPAISASYSDLLSGIDAASGRLALNGADVTAASAFGPAGVSFTPAARLPQGSMSVELSIADAAGNVSTATWSFVVRTVDPDRTTVVASPAVLPADGVAASTIVVTPRDFEGLPIGPGLEVSLALTSLNPVSPSSGPSFGPRIEGPVQDLGDGAYTATLSASPVGGVVQIRATVDGVSINQTASVTYTPSLARALAAGQPYDAPSLRLAAGAPVTLLGSGLDPDPSRNVARFTVGEVVVDGAAEAALECAAEAAPGAACVACSIVIRVPASLPAGAGTVTLVVNGAASPEARPIVHVGPVTLAKTQGDDQRGPIGTSAPLSLQIRVTNPAGAAMPGEFVRGVSVRGGGFAESSSPVATIETRTDGGGFVTGPSPILRAGENVITVSCLGLETTFRLIGGSRRIVDEVRFPADDPAIGMAGPVACACSVNGRLYILRKWPPGVIAVDTATNSSAGEGMLSVNVPPVSIAARPDGSSLVVGIPESAIPSPDGKTKVSVPAKIVFVDPGTLAPTGSLDLPLKSSIDLLAVSPVGPTLLAWSPNGSTLAVVDVAARTVRAVLSTPEGASAFAFLALSPDGSTAWVGGSVPFPVGARKVWSLDVATLALDSGAPANFLSGLGVVSPDGARLYASRQDMASVDVLSLPSRDILEKISFAGRNISSVLLSGTHDGKRLFVPAESDGLVEVLDSDPASATCHTVLGHVEIGTPTRQVAVTADDLFGYALSASGASLSQFAVGVDPSGGAPPFTVHSRVSLGAVPQRVAFAEEAGRIWVTLEPAKNSDGSVTQSVMIVDAETGAVLRTIVPNPAPDAAVTGILAIPT
ncbi:MAG: hypothetical protein HYS36_15060, partial [Candidatus Rokubacteria bacterium]|nr:hypothetical protein [Candidatus Rokubacteria bacterium]